MKLLKSFFREALICVASIILRLRKKWWHACGVCIVRAIKNKGSCCKIEGQGVLINPENLFLGDHVFIGRNFFIRCDGILKIGSYTHISRNATIHTVNHNATGELLPYDHKIVKKPVTIGKFVWIGMNVNIVPGVSIGDGAIIGMGTTVSKDVPPRAIVVGSAQRIVGYRDAMKTAALVKSGAFLLMGKS